MKTETEVKKPKVKAGSVWQMTTGSLSYLILARRNTSNFVEGIELCYETDTLALSGVRISGSCVPEEATELVPASRVEALLKALKSVKELMSGETYAIARCDGKGIDFPEAARIGDIFEKADIAIRNEEGQ